MMVVSTEKDLDLELGSGMSWGMHAQMRNTKQKKFCTPRIYIFRLHDSKRADQIRNDKH